MGFSNTYKFLKQHPLTKNHLLLAILRFLRWQMKSSFFKNKAFIYPFVNDSKLVIKKGMTGATGNIYAGLHEFQDMAFLLHFLKEGDLFVDIGANVGAYTVLASRCKKAKTICFEPTPETFKNLSKNISINTINSLVDAKNMALGSVEGKALFTCDLDTVNHVVQNGDNENSIEVDVSTLDSVLSGLYPLLIKMDVEGFETEVIKGGNETLKSDSLKAIIIELNGSGLRYGFDEKWIHEQLIDLGFNPYLYEPFSRKLILQKHFGTHNTIYLKDITFIEKRVIDSEKFSVLNYHI